MAVEIDSVLLSGNDKAIHEFASDTEHCVIVDWREEEGDLIGYVANAIPEAGLAFTEDESGEDILLSYQGKTAPVGLTVSPRDRYITIRAINRLLAGDYEMRLFCVTFDSDTHSFYVKPAAWWREAEHAHPTQIARLFRVVDEGLDFP
ncbi:MAG TPA: hypothetical protein VM165_24915 [Planctomycetaceae bacterium]|nr:hypothetical protein [Planctomycetaceae bacterium]